MRGRSHPASCAFPPSDETSGFGLTCPAHRRSLLPCRSPSSTKKRRLKLKRRPPKGNVDADGFLLALAHGDGDQTVTFQDGWLAERAPDVPRGRTLLSTLDRLSDGEESYNLSAAVAGHLHRIQVHLPFEVTPSWSARALDRKSSLRGSSLLAPADQLDKLGTNLASAFHALKNSFGRAHWDKTLEYVQLGLGQHIEDVVTWADPGGGNVGLSLKLAGLDQSIPTSQISDGMLSYLAFVALFRLDGKVLSLLAFDEPDLHLHPHLLMRVLDFFETMAQERPVLLATHSDRLLDGLRAPERSVVLCELGPDGATRLLRPDTGALASHHRPIPSPGPAPGGPAPPQHGDRAGGGGCVRPHDRGCEARSGDPPQRSPGARRDLPVVVARACPASAGLCSGTGTVPEAARGDGDRLPSRGHTGRDLRRRRSKEGKARERERATPRPSQDVRHPRRPDWPW
jgi:hypothetical protein